MRARNLKPGFFCNEQLSECSFQARILFAGLWCLADRKGVLQDRPKRIKAAVFPLDDISAADVQAMMDDLESNGLIMRYAACDGTALVYIPTFSKHQNPHPREKESELPLPADESREKVRRAPNLEGHASPVRCGAAVKRHGAAGLNPESGILNPDVLNPPSPGSHPEGVFQDDPSKLSQEEWEATPVGVMRLWFNRRRGNPGPSETREGILAELEEQQRLGVDLAAVGAAIKARDRDCSEKWFRFRAREIDAKAKKAESPIDRLKRLDAERRAACGQL